MFRIRIAAMIIGMIGALVAMAFENLRLPVGLPSLAMIGAAAGLFERKAQ